MPVTPKWPNLFIPLITKHASFTEKCLKEKCRPGLEFQDFSSNILQMYALFPSKNQNKSGLLIKIFQMFYRHESRVLARIKKLGA